MHGLVPAGIVEEAVYIEEADLLYAETEGESTDRLPCARKRRFCAEGREKADRERQRKRDNHLAKDKCVSPPRKCSKPN